jgi:hypothetical protein
MVVGWRIVWSSAERRKERRGSVAQLLPIPGTAHRVETTQSFDLSI